MCIRDSGTAELADVSTLLASATLFDFVYLASVMVLFTRKRTGALLVIMPLAAALNVGLNLVLLPRWGLDGAAIATVAGYVLMGALAVVATRRVATVPWDRPALASAGAVALVAVGAGLVLPTTGLYLVVRVLLVLALGLVAAAGAVRELSPTHRRVSTLLPASLR